jgi:hypothetical protein
MNPNNCNCEINLFVKIYIVLCNLPIVQMRLQPSDFDLNITRQRGHITMTAKKLSKCMITP